MFDALYCDSTGRVLDYHAGDGSATKYHRALLLLQAGWVYSVSAEHEDMVGKHETDIASSKRVWQVLSTCP